MPRSFADVDAAFEQIEDLARTAEAVLDDPQRTVWNLTTERGLTSAQIAAELGLEERLVRYHRSEAGKKVAAAYDEQRAGRLRFGVTVEQAATARFKPDSVARRAVERADRALERRAA